MAESVSPDGMETHITEIEQGRYEAAIAPELMQSLAWLAGFHEMTTLELIERVLSDAPISVVADFARTQAQIDFAGLVRARNPMDGAPEQIQALYKKYLEGEEELQRIRSGKADRHLGERIIRKV